VFSSLLLLNKFSHRYPHKKYLFYDIDFIAFRAFHKPANVYKTSKKPPRAGLSAENPFSAVKETTDFTDKPLKTRNRERNRF
jgi:hypothetical protein